MGGEKLDVRLAVGQSKNLSNSSPTNGSKNGVHLIKLIFFSPSSPHPPKRWGEINKF